MDLTPKYTLSSTANNTNTAISIVNLFTGNLPLLSEAFLWSLRNASFLIDLCEDMVFSPMPTLTIRGPRGVGGGGTPDFKWQGWSNGGKSQNPQKSLVQNLIPQKSHFDFPCHKNFKKYYVAMICWNYHKSSDCFEYPQKSLLKLSYSKIFLPKQNPEIKTFKPYKILRLSLSPEIRCAPPWVMDPGTYKHFILTFVKQIPQSPRWTLFLGYRIDSRNKVALTLSNLLINFF